MNLRNNIDILLSIVKSEFKNHLRYPMNVLWMIAYPLAILLIGVFIQQSFRPEIVQEMTGDAANGVSSYITMGVGMYFILSFTWYSVNAIGSNSDTIFALPINRTLFVFGKCLSELAINGFMAIFLFIISLAGSQVSIGRIFLTIALVFLTFFSFTGVGFITAAIGIRFAQFRKVVDLMNFLMQFLCGVLIPIYILPVPLKILAYSLPFTWGIDAIRAVALGIEPILSIEYEILLIIIIGLVSSIVGVIALRKAEERVKKIAINLH